MPPQLEQLQHLKALFASKTLFSHGYDAAEEKQMMNNVDWAQVLIELVQQQKLSLSDIAKQLVVENNLLDDIVLNNDCKLNISERMHLLTIYKMLGRKYQIPKVNKHTELEDFVFEHSSNA
jgi:hypothetical protein